MPADRVLEAATARRRGQPIPVAVTFDDGLRSNVDIASPLLLQYEVPATFFLTGLALAGARAFWWQSLQAAVDDGVALTPLLRRFRLSAPASATTIADLGRRIEGLSPVARDELARELDLATGDKAAQQNLTSAGVRDLVQAGFSIGFHTRRHDRMTALDDDALDAALRDGRSEIEAIVGDRLTAIAYPHGDADVRVARAAERAGFEIGFTGAVGTVGPRTPPLLLNRAEWLSSSPDRFALRLAWLTRPGQPTKANPEGRAP